MLRECDITQGANAMIFESALSAKVRGEGVTTIYYLFWHADMLLCRCFRYCKGWNCSSHVCCLLKLL